jgi:hypothetical protein
VEFSEYGDLKVGSIGPGTARQTWLNGELQHKVSIDSMVPTYETSTNRIPRSRLRVARPGQGGWVRPVAWLVCA